MAFPHDDLIAAELLRYLASQPGGRAYGPTTYQPLASRFPELTPDDLEPRVPTGERRWESKIPFSRQMLVERGLVFRAKEGLSPQRGVWIVTDAGTRAAQVETSASGTDGTATASEGIILGWNRSLWDDWPETYEGAVNIVMAAGRYTTRWSVGTRVDVTLGTDTWLLPQGGPYGIIGHGVVVSESFETERFATPGRTSRYVEVTFDVLLDEADTLSREVLDQVIPEIPWRHQFRSGNGLSPAIIDRLTQLRSEYIA